MIMKSRLEAAITVMHDFVSVIDIIDTSKDIDQNNSKTTHLRNWMPWMVDGFAWLDYYNYHC